MKYRCLILLFFFIPMLQGSEHRVVVLPFETLEGPWEGLALTLALQGEAEQHHLVPITAIRRKLNEYGLSLVTPLSLATRIKLGRDLDADAVVFGSVGEDTFQVTTFHTASYEQTHDYHPATDEPSRLLPLLARSVGIQLKEPASLDLYRLWASSYYAEDVAGAQQLMARLLEKEASGWLFVQEYLDLFGDPARDVETPAELSYWRDLFVDKEHLSHALDLSARLLKARHNPADFLVHARILAKTGELDEACHWLEKARDYGFARADASNFMPPCPPERGKSGRGDTTAPE